MKKRNGVRPYAVFLLFALMVTFGITQPYQAMAAIVTDTITYDSGDVYVGGYDEETGEKWENGIYTCKNGVKITGTWARDCLNGKATVRYSKKERYVGHFKNDQRWGNGRYFFKNGDKFKGNWKKDVMSGKGTYTWKNKNYVKGTWKSGKLNGKATLKLGKYKYSIKVSNGKLTKVYSRKKA